MKIPPTRNHRQLAAWINAHKLVDDRGRQVVASVDRWRTNTDRKISGTRLRHPGKGRDGLLLQIWPVGASYLSEERLFRHESGETYRRHAEAREWVERNLRRVEVMAKEVTPHLAQAIARAIAHSARTVLVQHGMPEAAKLASELGNNCAQNVVFLIERFLLDDDPAATLEAEIEALQG